jgi:sulfotransferase 6B1
MKAGKVLTGARVVRRSLRRARAVLRWRRQLGRLSLEGVPILFANSFPKSGTHLLTQVLQAIQAVAPVVDSGLPAVVTYQGDSGRQRSQVEILGDLQRLLPGDIGYGHLYALPETQKFLSQPGVAGYFILRDPRDVVVSHVHYITEMEPDHILHAHYTQNLSSFEERLYTSITGLGQVDFPFPDIRARFLPYMGWLDYADTPHPSADTPHPSAVLALKYEDFLANQEKAVSKILSHAMQKGLPLQDEIQVAARTVIARLDPQRSPTFRSGKSGGWRKAFSEDHKRLFKEVAGDLLIELGYETNSDW